MKIKFFLTGTIILILALGSALILQYSTPIGLGLTNDSQAYLNGAENILAGHGYGYNSGRGEVKPLTHFPPAYAIAISGVSRISGLEPQRAARLLAMGLIAANIILCALILGWITRSLWMASLGATFVFLSQVFYFVHVYLLSEPLYLFVSGMALLMVAVYFEHPRWPLLAIAGLFASYAYLTRYVGLAVFGAILLGLLFFLPGWRQRIHSTLVFLGFSLPGVILWTLRNLRLTGNPTNRNLIYHPISANEVATGIKNFWTWFLPTKIIPLLPGAEWGWAAAALGLLLIVGVVLALLRAKRKSIQGARQPALFLFGVYALGYAALIFLSMTFFDSSTKFEYRILIPALLSGTFVLLGWFWQVISRRPAWLRAAALSMIVVCLLWNAQDTYSQAKAFHSDGQGFLALRWRISKTVAYINQMPDRVIYSNRAPLIYLLTDRTAYVLPTREDDVKEQERAGYQADVEKVRQDVEDGAAIIVFDDAEIMESAQGRAWIEDLTHGMKIIEKTSDGIVYAAAD